ncbi:hypothetical protein, partial [Enterobacter intestinihominis]
MGKKSTRVTQNPNRPWLWVWGKIFTPRTPKKNKQKEPPPQPRKLVPQIHKQKKKHFIFKKIKTQYYEKLSLKQIRPPQT